MKMFSDFYLRKSTKKLFSLSALLTVLIVMIYMRSTEDQGENTSLSLNPLFCFHLLALTRFLTFPTAAAEPTRFHPEESNFEPHYSQSGTIEEFHIGDVLTVLTGHNLSPNGWDGAIQLTTFMLGEGRQSHLDEHGYVHGALFNLPPRMDECRSYLVKQFPELAKLNIKPLELFGENYTIRSPIFKKWLQDIEAKFGNKLSVTQIAKREKTASNKFSTEELDLQFEKLEKAFQKLMDTLDNDDPTDRPKAKR